MMCLCLLVCCMPLESFWNYCKAPHFSCDTKSNFQIEVSLKTSGIEQVAKNIPSKLICDY